MRRVSQKAVLRTEYSFCTGNACFLHRMPLKMRRVPQEAFLSTARIFRTIEGPLRYRMHKERRIACSKYRKYQKGEDCLQRIYQTARKEETIAQSAARLIGENKKRTTRKIVLFPIWGAMWGSNPRHPEPQSGALPTELIAPCQFGVTKVQRFFGIAREYSKKELSLCDWNKNRIREYVKRD